MVTFFDGNFVDDADATVSVRCRALNYGLGCFGGVRGYLADDGEQVFLFRLHEHVARLDYSSRILCLRLPDGIERTKEILIELLRRNEVHHDVYMRPMVFSNSNLLAPILDPDDSCFTAYCMPLKRYLDKDAIDVAISSWRRVADNAIPSRTKPTGIYLNSALARREAMDNGFDEAIFLTDSGKVSEGSAEHVFIVRDGVFYSPPSTEDNLDGITRRSLITMLTEDLGYDFCRAFDRPARNSTLPTRCSCAEPVLRSHRFRSVDSPYAGRRGDRPPYGQAAEAFRRCGARAGGEAPRLVDAGLGLKEARVCIRSSAYAGRF